MHHHCIKFFLIIVFLLLPAEAALAIAAPPVYSLRDAIEAAQVNNRNIKLEQTRLNSVKTAKTQAIAEFLPSVSVSAQYGQRNSFYQGQNYDRSSKQSSKEIKLEQPIFDGLHSVSKYREADYKIKSGSAKTSDKIQEISFAAVQSYCNLFRYQQLVKLYEEDKELGRKFLELAKRRKEARIIDKSEIIKFTYETSLTEEKYLDALNKLNKARFDYQNIIGELHENLLEPEITEEEFNKEKLLEAALESNNNVRAYRYNYLASKAAYNAEKSNFLPKVSLVASASEQDRVVYLNNQDLNSKSIFFNVSIPIFQKGVEYANVNKARYDKDAALEEYEIIKENITKEVNQVLEEYRFFSKMNETNKRLSDLAQSRAEVFKERSKLRVEDPIELIRATIEANERQANYVNSRMDLVITYYKIKYFLAEI